MKVELMCYHYNTGNIYMVEGLGYFAMFMYTGSSVTELKTDENHINYEELEEYGRFLKEAHKALKKHIKKTHPLHNGKVELVLKEEDES